MADVKNFWSPLAVGLKQAELGLHIALNAGKTAMLWGQYGIGKTAIVSQLAESLRHVKEEDRFSGMVTINPSTIDIIDFKLPYVDTIETEKISRFAYSELLPREGRWIIFVDEINTAMQSLQPTLYSLILEGRIGNYRLPPGCFRVAAGNREEDQCAAQPMSAALKDRLSLHMYVEANVDDWLSWSARNRIRPEIMAWIKFAPQNLNGHNPDDPTGGCTPRSLEGLSCLLDSCENILGSSNNMESNILYGSIGQGAASVFSGFLTMYKSEIDADECIKNPETAKLPERCDLALCVSYAISSKINKKNIGAALTYLDRLQQTYKAVAISAALERDRSIETTKEYKEFLIKNVYLFTASH
jgi:hypothetical protein